MKAGFTPPRGAAFLYFLLEWAMNEKSIFIGGKMQVLIQTNSPGRLPLPGPPAPLNTRNIFL